MESTNDCQQRRYAEYKETDAKDQGECDIETREERNTSVDAGDGRECEDHDQRDKYAELMAAPSGIPKS